MSDSYGVKYMEMMARVHPATLTMPIAQLPVRQRGKLLKAMGKVDAALGIFQQVLQGEERELGENLPLLH